MRFITFTYTYCIIAYVPSEEVVMSSVIFWVGGTKSSKKQHHLIFKCKNQWNKLSVCKQICFFCHLSE